MARQDEVVRPLYGPGHTLGGRPYFTPAHHQIGRWVRVSEDCSELIFTPALSNDIVRLSENGDEVIVRYP